MPPRNIFRPLSLLCILFSPPTYSEPSPTPLCHHRRECAARILTIATTIEPAETADALRLARRTLRQNSLTTYERTFLRSTIQDGIARGIACAAGGAAASYAMLRLVLHVIPLYPNRLIANAAVGIVSFGAAAVELAAFPDLTTVELLMMGEKGGHRARRSIERWNSDLVLLRTIDRQMGGEVDKVDTIDGEFVTADYFETEMQFR